MNNLTKEQVVQKIRPYLSQFQNGFTLAVVPEGIRRVNGWWRVPVRPSVQPKKLYEYYAALADIEMDIDEKENLNVVLTTSEPEDISS